MKDTMNFTGGCLLIRVGSAMMPVSFIDLEDVLPRKTAVYQDQRDMMSQTELQTYREDDDKWNTSCFLSTINMSFLQPKP